MCQRLVRTILLTAAGMLLFVNTCLAVPVIYRISGDISVDTSVGSGVDSAGLEGASFVAELIVDSDATPAVTFSTADSERASYATTAASIRFFNRPSLPNVTLSYNGLVQAINFFPQSTFNDHINLHTVIPEILGQIEGNVLGWPGEQNGVLPQDYFPGTGVPPVPVFSEPDFISQSVFGFIHDLNGDGVFNEFNGDTVYLVSNGRITASLAASCDIQLNPTPHGDGDTVTATVFRLTNPGAEPVAIELKSWLEGPGFEPIPWLNQGADGSLVLPANLDLDIGPVTLFTVPSAAPRGNYKWNCRLLDPVTGEIRATDINRFEIQ